MAVDENDREVLCPWCGTLQALPRGLANPDRARLFERANHQFRNGDFERAKTSYERILDSDPTDAEAYWSLVLCRFGVEYVVDEGKYVSTIRRMPIGGSIYSDEDYKSAIHYATDAQARFYECEAARINEIQAGFYALFNREMHYDAFICYKNDGTDAQIARHLYELLSSEGVHTFFAAETLKNIAGAQYEPHVFAALNSARVMIVVATKRENLESNWVKNEWNRFLSLMRSHPEKLLIPVYQDMRPEDLPSDFCHLQALDLSDFSTGIRLIKLIRACLNLTPAPERQNRAKTAEKAEQKTENDGAAKSGASVQPVPPTPAQPPKQQVQPTPVQPPKQQVQPTPVQPPKQQVQSTPVQPPKPRGVLSKARFREFYMANYEKTTEICFLDSNCVEFDQNRATDLSEAQNGSVLAYMQGNTLRILGPGGVRAPKDCSELFTGRKETKNGVVTFVSEYLKRIIFQNCFDTSDTISMSSMFEGCSLLTKLDLSRFDTSNVTSMRAMYWNCSSLTSLDVSSFDTSNVTDMRCMFGGCSSLASLDVSRFDTSKVTDMGNMFNRCSSLTSLDVSSFDTSSVTNMRSMFEDCSFLTSLDVSGFDTSNVTDMGWMFSHCSSLTSLDVSGFDTSNVTSMCGMFNGCSSLTSLDVSGFDTSNVTHMGSMFNRCSSLTSLDVSGFDTFNVTRMHYMFNRCTSLTSLNVSSFDTSNVTNMSYMFYHCSSLTSLDVSGFDTSNVTNMGYMFFLCSSLTSLDVSGFDTSNVTDMDDMFYGCPAGISEKDMRGKGWLRSIFKKKRN